MNVKKSPEDQEHTLKVGILGCGAISDTYCKGLSNSPHVRLVACADRNADAARALAENHGLRAMSIQEMLVSPEIDIIVNLTPPIVHAEIGLQILRAGKHLFQEKPLATNISDARALIAEAERLHLRIGCASDTFLGASHQACRAEIDAGAIGEVIGGSVQVYSDGMESWHPNPRFFFEPGGGPILDLGPYYVTQLVHLLGPVAEVVAMGRIGRTTRTIGSGPNKGNSFAVQVPTTIYAVLRFQNGAVINFSASWDAIAHQDGQSLELFGTEGCLVGPSPNFFDGRVQVCNSSSSWNDVNTERWAFGKANYELPHGERVAYHRGLGVIEMAASIKAGRPHRANAELAFHVLEVLVAIERAAEGGQLQRISTTVERPIPLPHGHDQTVFGN